LTHWEDDLLTGAYAAGTAIVPSSSLTTQPIEILQLALNSLGKLKCLTDQDEKLGLT
jgi:hypothetical protein